MIILFHIVRIVCITSTELQPMAVQYNGHVISASKAICFVLILNTHKYYYYVVFLFHNYIVITVVLEFFFAGTFLLWKSISNVKIFCFLIYSRLSEILIFLNTPVYDYGWLILNS